MTWRRLRQFPYRTLHVRSVARSITTARRQQLSGSRLRRCHIARSATLRYVRPQLHGASQVFGVHRSVAVAHLVGSWRVLTIEH